MTTAFVQMVGRGLVQFGLLLFDGGGMSFVTTIWLASAWWRLVKTQGGLAVTFLRSGRPRATTTGGWRSLPVAAKVTEELNAA